MYNGCVVYAIINLCFPACPGFFAPCCSLLAQCTAWFPTTLYANKNKVLYMANRNPNTTGLRPTNKLSNRERSELGRKGGIQSQANQRKKRLQREILAEILSMPAPSKAKKKLADVFGTHTDISNEMAILASVVRAARDKGSLSAAVFIRDTLGENPANKIDPGDNTIAVAIVPSRQSLEQWRKSNGQ